ncbi:P-loop containing nucleoside triphosphate hydrolase protein, partial [Mycena galericulata]
LPAQPKIFHGRETETQHMVECLLLDSPRVAIIGPGGVGKTSLATAALHHSDVVSKYHFRWFVSCQSSASCGALVSAIHSSLGLDQVGNLSKQVLNHLLAAPPSLLVLDNFETPWEPKEARAEVEEFLSLLADIPQLALVITMRGAERPGKVRWSRPFLKALEPLTSSAARQTFLDIADTCDEADLGRLLPITNNLPLAVTLLASLVAYEDPKTVLSRWENENTSILSDGSNKRSNLDLSISLSLSSPRMLWAPNALQLLGIFSVLPDGISDADLTESGLPIGDVLAAKSTLLRTSLAYVDRDRRIKVLVPIREYVLRCLPPPLELLQPLRQYFSRLISLWKDYQQLSLGDIVPRITANLGNLHRLLVYSLDNGNPDLKGVIRRCGIRCLRSIWILLMSEKIVLSPSIHLHVQSGAGFTGYFTA